MPTLNHTEYMRQYRARHPHKSAEASRRYQARHRDRINAARRDHAREPIPAEVPPIHLRRFLSWVSVADSGCWLWTGTVMSSGYGGLSWFSRSALAHRIAYDLFVGPIPNGLTIDHRCRVKLCVNPEHLEPVTNAENVRRERAQRKSVAS